jgi:hypothetical protein
VETVEREAGAVKYLHLNFTRLRHCITMVSSPRLEVWNNQGFQYLARGLGIARVSNA